MTEMDVLICAPYTQESDLADRAIPGTRIYNCQDCGGQIMVAPSGQRMLNKDPNVTPVCMPCGFKRAGEADEGSDFGVAEGAMSEIRAWLKEHEA